LLKNAERTPADIEKNIAAHALDPLTFSLSSRPPPLQGSHRS